MSEYSRICKENYLTFEVFHILSLFAFLAFSHNSSSFTAQYPRMTIKFSSVQSRSGKVWSSMGSLCKTSESVTWFMITLSADTCIYFILDSLEPGPKTRALAQVFLFRRQIQEACVREHECKRIGTEGGKNMLFEVPTVGTRILRTCRKGKNVFQNYLTNE